MVTHGSLQFSRCTRFPWSQDLPSIFPYDGERYFCVRRLRRGPAPAANRAQPADIACGGLRWPRGTNRFLLCQLP
ncbi:DUF6193 family natural product biosynthesis protein [Streptomyces sp. NRRL S-146]|uniref:DUF6193 family natural product biosynthesis protein n=1 Tax=Streptomyces sp. NRRL S-146 TaxID=1463884 RepID=UPI003B63C8BB